jgi:hypothetical protein
MQLHSVVEYPKTLLTIKKRDGHLSNVYVTAVH